MQRILAFLLLFCFSLHARAQDFKNFLDGFNTGYLGLHIPEPVFDYHTYFSNIPSSSHLDEQSAFFEKEKQQLHSFPMARLDSAQRLYYAHILYEIDFNLQRIGLEKQWLNSGKKMPQNGLHSLTDYKDWYRYYIKKYTSTSFTPEQVYELGLSETKRVREHIIAIQKQLGFYDKAAFYKHLQNDSFYLTDKNAIINAYAEIDKRVRQHLDSFVALDNVEPVAVMEWPDAGPNTPPGMYISRDENAYGKDVFEYNFYAGRHNRRAMEWLYMHEAIPGHHLQSSFRKKLEGAPAFQQLFYYPGNFEGWGCYVEYYGKAVGLYSDPYKELGKWEWDLVRSVRLVLDAGIHYYGWDHDKAAKFWKENITGQDDIMEREITRVTNWPGQALSYKVGAYEIEAMKKFAMQHDKHFDIRSFHYRYLLMSYYPLAVVKEAMDKYYASLQ